MVERQYQMMQLSIKHFAWTSNMSLKKYYFKQNSRYIIWNNLEIGYGNLWNVALGYFFIAIKDGGWDEDYVNYFETLLKFELSIVAG